MTGSGAEMEKAPRNESLDEVSGGFVAKSICD